MSFDERDVRTNLDFQPVNNLDVGLRATVSYSVNKRAPNGGTPGSNSNIARGGYNMAKSGALPYLPIFHPTVVRRPFFEGTGVAPVLSSKKAPVP